MSKTERIARNFWTAGWAVLFVCTMTVLSELGASPSGSAANSAPPHFFSAKSAGSAPAQQ